MSTFWPFKLNVLKSFHVGRSQSRPKAMYLTYCLLHLRVGRCTSIFGLDYIYVRLMWHDSKSSSEYYVEPLFLIRNKLRNIDFNNIFRKNPKKSIPRNRKIWWNLVFNINFLRLTLKRMISQNTYSRWENPAKGRLVLVNSKIGGCFP